MNAWRAIWTCCRKNLGVFYEQKYTRLDKCYRVVDGVKGKSKGPSTLVYIYDKKFFYEDSFCIKAASQTLEILVSLQNINPMPKS